MGSTLSADLLPACGLAAGCRSPPRCAPAGSVGRCSRDRRSSAARTSRQVRGCLALPCHVGLRLGGDRRSPARDGDRLVQPGGVGVQSADSVSAAHLPSRVDPDRHSVVRRRRSFRDLSDLSGQLLSLDPDLDERDPQRTRHLHQRGTELRPQPCATVSSRTVSRRPAPDHRGPTHHARCCVASRCCC